MFLKDYQNAVRTAVFAGLIISSPATFAQSESSELEKIIQLAFKNSPSLKAKVNKAQSLNSEYNAQSWLADSPTVALSYRNIPISSWPSFGKHPMSGIDISISQRFAAPTEYHYRNKVFRSKHLSAKERVAEFKRMLRRNVTRLYHEIGFLQTKIEILKDNKRSLNDIVQVARALVRVNKMNSSQLLKIEADLAIMDNRILEAEGLLAKVIARLNSICATSISRDLLPKSNWQTPARGIKVPSTFEVTKHPFYIAQINQFKASQAMASHERAKLFPGVTVSGGYTFRDEIVGKDTGEDFFSLKVSTPIPLYYGFKDRHKINAKASLEKQSQQELKQVKLSLEGEWQGETESAAKALIAYRQFQELILPKYHASYKAQLGALASGSVSLLDVLDSYRRYLKVAIDKAKQFKILKQSIATLEYLATEQTKGKVQ